MDAGFGKVAIAVTEEGEDTLDLIMMGEQWQSIERGGYLKMDPYRLENSWTIPVGNGSVYFVQSLLLIKRTRNDALKRS